MNNKTVPIQQSQGTNFQHFMGQTQQGNQGQVKLSQLPGGQSQPPHHTSPPHSSHALDHSREVHGHGDGKGHGDGGHHTHYNPLAIPCDWEIAKTHASARRTAPDKKKGDNPTIVKTCPCCGFEVDRQDIEYCSNPMALSFLGSGFTLFYNYLKYCIIILFIQLIIKQIYNLYTNFEGNYCAKVEKLELEGHIVHETNCPDSIFLTLSMANKLNNKEALHNESILNLISLGIIMIILLYFRKSQRQIDATIDEEALTPADYTICVKNIPVGLKVDYKQELKNLFENFAVLDSNKEIIVRKVVLVHDIEDVIKLEKKLDDVISKKKDTIKRNNYQFDHPSVKAVDEEIEQIEHQIHHIEEDYDQNNTKFAGIAFVSFDNEDMKDMVMSNNTHTSMERMKTYFNRGQTPGITDNDLSWHGQKLFLEQAPEPNDVDWEFIHVQTGEKIFKRIRAWIYYFLFEGTAFFVIYLISLRLAKNVDKAHEEELKGNIDQKTMTSIELYSYGISFLIVLFNKFGVAKICHYIVDDEKISSKTKFQVAFVYKYALALFLNAAIISYMVDIVILKNVVGYGGFIQNETQIFILNALFPPFVWLVDPWSCCKNIWRKYLMSKGNQSLLTQQEANTLMEQPDYLSAKRYSDVMKTMWFTFLYGTAIPLGTFCSAVGILFYYFIDYYNILRRRTVKESISIQLSTEMIEFLEAIIFWSAFGSATMSYTFFKEISKIEIALFIVAIVYANLPMEDISQFIFPVVNNEEHKPYADGCIDFDTDYDRENPITRHKAIAEWNAFLQSQAKGAGKGGAHHQHQEQAGEFGYGGDGRLNQRRI